MKKFLILLLFIASQILLFSKEIEINFNIPVGKVIFSEKNNTQTEEIAFYDGHVKLNLENKEYFFIFSSPNYPLIQRDIDISKAESPISIYFSKEGSVTVSGSVKSGNANIGAAKVIFTNSKNLSYNTTTDIFGNFKINIPKGNYKVSVDRKNFKINKKNSIIYQFTNPSRPYFVNIDLNKIPSFIKGQAVDENGDSIPYPEFSIKTEKNTLKITGNEFGIFELNINPGIVTILGQKDGYVENGVVKNIEKNSSVTNIEIQLTRIKSTISGIVTDGVKPLRKATVVLRDKDFNKISSTKTNDDGFYEFYKVPSKKEVFITVMEDNKVLLQTETFDLDRDIKDYNLILQ